VCAFTFLTNFAIGGLAPAFYILSIEFDKSMEETSHLLLYPILVLGAFNFFWVPVANYVGKRPVFVFASALLCACYVWGAMANSFKSLLWSNIIAAFAGSSTEALGAAIVNDLYFLHERGAKMGMYMNAIAGGNTLGPLICGFIVTNLSWRWHKWIAVILTALNFLAILLLVPETRYTREVIKGVGVAICPSSDKIVMADEKYLRPKSSNQILYQHAKNSRRQELSLWSGVSETSLVKMFLRYVKLIWEGAKY
jgi:MFS family permease